MKIIIIKFSKFEFIKSSILIITIMYINFKLYLNTSIQRWIQITHPFSALRTCPLLWIASWSRPWNPSSLCLSSGYQYPDQWTSPLKEVPDQWVSPSFTQPSQKVLHQILAQGLLPWTKEGSIFSTALSRSRPCIGSSCRFPSILCISW